MNENPTVEVKKLQPITKFIYTLGVLPTSYLMTMTYQEQVTWLCNFIQQTVIPAINDDVDAIQELQQLYNDLQDYVDNYFENLDVTEEINNKLDEMFEDGDLEELIKRYINPQIDSINQEITRFENLTNNNIQNFENTTTAQINSIENLVSNVASGSPLVASSTDEMTDTTRIYVNTTDGKWYYYDGDSWEIGGTYQSDGISNGSIDVLMFDDDLQSNFFMDLSTPLEMGNAYQGYYKNDGTLNTDSSFANYHISLENGETYVFSGRNISHLASLVIKDNSNNLIYQSNPNDETGYCSFVFKAKENNLTAYISLPANPSATILDWKLIRLRKMNNLYNQLKYSSTITPVITVADYFIGGSAQLTQPQITITSFTGANIKVYPMSKGRTYNIRTWNWSNLCGLYISDLAFDKLYSSSTSNIGNTYVAVNYDFTAVKDGYIMISECPGTAHPSTIAISNQSLSIQLANVLNGKKLGIDGDSIINGAGNSSTGYGDIIATNNNMSKSKVAVGGATIATGTQNSGVDRHWICQGVLSIASDCDYVIVNGGFNDYGLGVSLGSLTSSYTADVDSTTFYGGMETLCRNLLSRFPSKKIAFITDHNINNTLFQTNSQSLTMADYIEAIYKTCEKYGIHIIDVGKNTHLSTGLSAMASAYTDSADGIHPNASGYNTFYVDYVTNELKNL